MTVVRNTILDAASLPMVGALVTVELVASLDGSAPGYNPATEEVLQGPWYHQLDEAGQWQQELTPNGSITPANTWYRETVRGRGTEITSTFEAPSSGGTVWVGDHLITPPAALDPIHETAADPHPGYVLNAELVAHAATPHGGSADLSDDDPLAPGSADPGVGIQASRDDHVHPTTGLALESHDHDGDYALEGVGLLVARPASGASGELYAATDTEELYVYFA